VTLFFPNAAKTQTSRQEHLNQEHPNQEHQNVARNEPFAQVIKTAAITVLLRPSFCSSLSIAPSRCRPEHGGPQCAWRDHRSGAEFPPRSVRSVRSA
jgi:hypothetical protein